MRIENLSRNQFNLYTNLITLFQINYLQQENNNVIR